MRSMATYSHGTLNLFDVYFEGFTDEVPCEAEADQETIELSDAFFLRDCGIQP